MDFNKYNPLKKPPLQNWKDSVPVILLSEYLKMKSDAGIKLLNNNGVPCLSFSPGLTNKDKETGRWQIAENALALYVDAVPDLTELLGGGKIELPIHHHHSQVMTTNNKKGAGPS